MDVTEIICRSCMAEMLLSDTHSINEIGWDILTFKQMFETALGYQITISEPQQFCDSCARTLIQWHEFKSLCQSTQEILVPVKIEPELHSETIWYIKNEPLESVNTESEVKVEHVPMETDDTEIGKQRFMLQLNVILRNFGLQPLKNGVSLGQLKITGTSSAEANQQIWSFIKPHLKREICFDNENKPIWHEDETPQATNLTHFILFKDLKAKKTYESLSYRKLLLWSNRSFTLCVYPYSKNIASVLQWNLAKAALIDQNPVEEKKLTKLYSQKKKQIESLETVNEPEVPIPEPVMIEPSDVCVPTDTSNFKYIVVFDTSIRHFKKQTSSKVSLGKYTISGNDVTEFRQNLWIAVKCHIVREVIVNKNDQMSWHPRMFPNEDELSKFVDFSCKKKCYYFEDMKSSLLESWTAQSMELNIYPYSRSIETKDMWMKLQSFINLSKVQEVTIEDIIKDLVTQLKLRHENKFPDAHEINWKTWAYYINSFSNEKHERLINETPPTQLLPFFDTKLDLFPEITTKDTSETYSVSLVTRLKFTKKGRGKIFGRFTITGSTIEEFKHSIWIKVRPYLAREVIVANDNEMPSWSVNVIPTESDLHKFVSISDRKFKKESRVNSLTDALLRRYSRSHGLIMNIYPFSSAMSSKVQLNYIKKSLLETKRCSATTRVVEKLKELHEFVSFDWNMWAHYIQAHESSEQEMLMRQEPPRELAHLFISKSLQNLPEPDEDEVDEEKYPSNTMSAEELYALAPLSREEIADTSKLKKCPFPGCSSVIKTSFLSHMRYCKHNPKRDFVYRWRCQFKGCSRSYIFRRFLQRHMRTCSLNPNRELPPLQQCPHCSVPTRSLKSHIWNKHSNREYVCHLCGTVLRSKAIMKLHILRIHKQMRYVCDKCPNEYKTPQTLKAHVKRDHSEKPLELNHKCEHCSYATHDRKNYLRHLKYYHDENFKKPECPICGESKSTQTALRIHMLTHADTEFNCNVCSHVSKTEKGLKCHMTLHEEWKYECPVCFIKRRSSYEVRMHCKRKHPDYKLPPKWTVMKTTSRRHGNRSVYYPEDDESSLNN